MGRPRTFFLWVREAVFLKIFLEVFRRSFLRLYIGRFPCRKCVWCHSAQLTSSRLTVRRASEPLGAAFRRLRIYLRIRIRRSNKLACVLALCEAHLDHFIPIGGILNER